MSDETKRRVSEDFDAEAQGLKKSEGKTVSQSFDAESQGFPTPTGETVAEQFDKAAQGQPPLWPGEGLRKPPGDDETRIPEVR
jgi:hypothetical protein